MYHRKSLWRLFPGVNLLLLAVLAPAGRAANGVWTNGSGGSWTNSANWNATTVPGGSGSTADFSTLTLTGSPVVTLDGAQTVGTLNFGDRGNADGWALNAGNGGSLLLSVGSGSPVINVTNQAVTIGAAVAGANGLMKTGGGTLVFTTTNTYTGITIISNGAVTFSGGGANSGTTSNLLVGGASGSGVLNLYGTGNSTFATGGGICYIGGTGVGTDTGAGAVNQTAGNATFLSSGAAYLTLGAGGGGTYGSYNLSGGSLTITGGSGCRIGAGGLGSYVQTGGALNCGRYFVVGGNFSGGTNFGVATFTGGTATVAGGYYLIIGNLNGSKGTLNLGTEAGGNAAITSASTAAVYVGQTSGANGSLNLDSGTLTINAPILKTSGATGTLNLDGGTVRAGTNNVCLITNTLTSVNVYNGGVTFDSQTNWATVAAALLTTAGNGVYPTGGVFNITSGGGSGYLGAPLVAVTNTGTGTGVTAIANVSGGVVTGVTITCPGQNYAAGNVLGFIFSGGGAATPANTYLYTLKAGDLAANTLGGVTKIGSGALTLSATNTYAGLTVVSNGELYVNGALNSTGAVSVGSDGILGGTGSVGLVAVADGGGVEGGQGGTGSLTVAQLAFQATATINLTPGSNAVPLTVTTADGLAVGNEADSVTINIEGSGLAPGTYHLIRYNGDLKGVGFEAFQLGSTPAGAYTLVDDAGYVDLVVTAYPTITDEPASVTVAVDGSAVFSVTAADPGALTYQWRLNGAAIAGATNATLTLASVTSASQGVYTVVVSDGTDTALSTGAVLTVTSPTVTGQWDFKDGDLRATVGSDLQSLGDSTNRTGFTTISINGQSAGVMAFGAYSTNEGLLMPDGALPNGPAGSQFINQYTLVMDVMYPAASAGQWRAVFQTDPFNHPGTDAEFYVGNATAAPSPNGIGISGGQFNGTLAANTWYRIAFAVDLTAAAGQQLKTYLNGTQVGSQSLPGGIDGQYALGPAAQLFTTGLGGGSFTQTGYVSSIQFVNGTMSAGALAALGGPVAGKLPPGAAVPQLAIAPAGPAGVQLGWSGPAGNFQVQSAGSLASPNWQTLAVSATNASLALTASNAAGFFRLSEIIPDLQVGQLPEDNEEVIPTKQIIESAGKQIQFSGRPVDMVLSPDGRTAYIKDETSLVVADVATWTVLQTLNYPSNGASMHGIATSPSGSDVYVTTAGNQIFDWTVGTNRALTYARAIMLTSGDSEPSGIAISADGTTAYVCLNLDNSLAVVNLAAGTVSQTIKVGIAPWDVKLSTNGATAYVSDWGGRVPTNGDMTAESDGTAVVVDSRGIASSGEVSFVNLAGGTVSGQTATGLHPTCLALSADGTTLYVANANSDSVTVINTLNQTVKETFLVRPCPTLPFGTEPSGLALSPNGTNLFVACADNNGIAVVALAGGAQTNSTVTGFIPTDWYPGAVLADGGNLYAVNVKGLGARYGQPQSIWQIFLPLGTANKIPLPSAAALSKYTSQVLQNGRVPQILQTQQPAVAGAAPVPVPAHVGEPSVFQHVLYIIKENKTYDEVFGDMAQGNSDSNLCIYPRYVSPNHHALASQFVLLDNYYCNGVNSADGHCWSDEGNCADQYEKSFGGFNRSYAMGTDPLVYSSSGFIWNNVLQHGLTFRNYGEFYYSLTTPYSWLQYYQDYTNGNHALRSWSMTCGVTNLATYTSTNLPGSNLNIPDVVRAYGFIQELNAAQASGVWPAFNILYLCDDHTGGAPSAQAQVADNDLALGQAIQAVSNSRFWTNTVIFVIEDDPQSGYDHVDGHRSLCLVVSPYTKRNQVVSTFYNQCGMVHTMEQILGIPPMNQQDAMGPLMGGCFTNVPDFTPYTCLPNNVDLAAGVSGTATLSPKARYYAKIVRKWGPIQVDHVDDNIFNRYIWHSIKGDAPYPAKYVGAHGKGLKKLGLVLVKSPKDDDD